MHLVFDPPPSGHLPGLVACQQAFIGHELPNHLIALQGFARLLADGSLDAEESQLIASRLASLSRRTDEAARRLADIGRDLREPAWGLPVSPTAVALDAAAEARALHPALNVTADDAGLRVPCSSRLLHRVFKELFVNSARASANSNVTVTARPYNNCAHLTVADDGPGVDDPRLLTEPFAAGRLPDAPGPGLGFFLVRQAASVWGARLEVHSEPSKGLRVELFIPLSAPESR
jgi:signal transduction histidine kinase